jgi:hypothetical protein
MVRYNEFNQPLIEDEQDIHTLLKTYFKIGENKQWVEGENYHIVNGKIDVFGVSNGQPVNTGGVTLIQKKSPGRIPIPFGGIVGNFVCLQCKLDSLENSPTTVSGYFHCTGNKLTSLKYLPKRMTILHCSGNPLKSLEGIEIDSEIETINLAYSSTLPMLRLLCASENVNFKDKMQLEQKEYEPLQDIINASIFAYSNIKERIIKAQYAMIKAGYKSNAKW